MNAKIRTVMVFGLLLVTSSSAWSNRLVGWGNNRIVRSGPTRGGQTGRIVRSGGPRTNLRLVGHDSRIVRAASPAAPSARGESWVSRRLSSWLGRAFGSR